MSGRYAIYFAPPAGGDLARFGDGWLERPVLSGFDDARLRALTEAPRHYGFHGTLKPPFRLADGCDAEELRRALAAFAARQAGFEIAALCLQEVGDFLALVPVGHTPAISVLAAACVSEFEAYRAPPEAGELARRQAAGLTARQMELLARWGYPYVLDEFRFHLTLTGPISDAAERMRVRGALADATGPLLKRAVPVRELCLFQQPDRATPFRMTDRLPFGR